MASDIKLVFHSSTIAMMHSPINIRLNPVTRCPAPEDSKFSAVSCRLEPCSKCWMKQTDKTSPHLPACLGLKSVPLLACSHNRGTSDVTSHVTASGTTCCFVSGQLNTSFTKKEWN